MKSSVRYPLAIALMLLVGACDEDKKGDGPGGGSYSFSASSGTKIGASGLSLVRASSANNDLPLDGVSSLCENQPNYFCVGPSALTGKYFSVGLLIQANGQGMQTYFHDDAWSDITGTSTAFDFDAAAPVTHTGEIRCCGGSGDLTGENVYFSDVTYLFGYLDATFDIPYSAQQQGTVSAAMKSSHTVRFVLADGVMPTYKRGDLLYKDSDGAFKWCDQNGVLTTTRPASPITMNEKVVNYTSPFAEITNLAVPVFYSGLGTTAQTSEEKLKEAGKTYSFTFDTSSLLVVTKGKDMLSLVQNVKDLLSVMHLNGMPHSTITFDKAGTSQISIE